MTLNIDCLKEELPLIKYIGMTHEFIIIGDEHSVYYENLHKKIKDSEKMSKSNLNLILNPKKLHIP
jgi:hypothetical protein